MGLLIENLPEDVILHIFEYLDGKSLKNSALVCKIWCDVICGSSRLMKHYTLTLCDSWMEKIDEIMSLTRKFHSMRVSMYSNNMLNSYREMYSSTNVMLLKQISVKHGTHLRKLTLHNTGFENLRDFFDIISNMPLLLELVLSRVKFNFEGDILNEKQITLSKLNKLTVNTCDWNIFRFFMASPIKELNISNKLTLVDAQQLKTYIEFLEASDKLESIELDLAAYVKTFQTKLDSKICFKLKKFKFFSYSPSYEASDVDMNFQSFLESQASSLKHLDLNYALPSVIEIIFTKLKALEKLRFNAVSLPDYGGYNCPLLNLKELIFHDDIISEHAVAEILSNCNNLETLSAHYDPSQCISKLLPAIAVNCPKVKSLSVDKLLVDVPLERKFDHLQFLHVQRCINFEHLIKFLNINASIETLSLNLSEAPSLPDDTILEALFNQYNLRHFIVKAGYNTLKAIYNKVKIDYRNLESLELKTMHDDNNNILIRFPNDKSQWQPNFFGDNK